MAYKLLTKLYYQDKKEYKSQYEIRFNGPSTYHIPLKIHENEAFVVVTTEILNKIENIYKANNKITTLCDGLPSAAFNAYINKCLIDEIYETNDIEGVRSTKKELREALASNDKALKFSGLVKKYSKLINNDKIPLNNSLDIRALYDEIVAPEINPSDKPDGKIFRKELVEVVTVTEKVIHTGLMPEKKIIQYVNDMLDYLKNDNAPDLIKIAVCHYFVGYIHPFYDGNGRINRFISSYLLRNFLNKLIPFRISYVVKNSKKKYYAAFEDANDKKGKGDITFFVTMFLNVIEEAADILINELSDAARKLTFYGTTLNTISQKKSIFSSEFNIKIYFILIQVALFETDGIDIDELSLSVNKSTASTRKVIQQLVDSKYAIAKRIGRKIHYTANLKKLEEDIEAN